MVNFVLSLLLALGLTWIIPLQPPHATGLLLLSAAAAAPFLPKLAEIAGGNLASSVALTILLTGASIVFIPLALPLLVPGLHADAWAIARPLLFFMLVPLGIGFWLAHTGASWLERLLALVHRLSNLALILLLVLLVGLNLKIVLGTVGSFAIATYTLYLLALMGVAWLLGAADRPARKVFVLGAGCRNIAAALVVATPSRATPVSGCPFIARGKLRQLRKHLPWNFDDIGHLCEEVAPARHRQPQPGDVEESFFHAADYHRLFNGPRSKRGSLECS